MSGDTYGPNEGSPQQGPPGQGFPNQNSPGQGFPPQAPQSQGFLHQGYAAAPGSVLPPMPSSPPPAPPDALRATAVALLNLTGLGLGYLLVRRWLPMTACLAATVVLLLVALPADADGVPGAALVVYAVLLLAAAVHGASLGLRTRLVWPGQRAVALVLGVVLLAVPVGGALWYDSAQKEAVERALLDRLDRADDRVTGAGQEAFATAKSDYVDALAVYRDLAVHHSDSRAAAQVPDRLKTYYTTVAAAYSHNDYCTAIEPLKFLQTVPDSMPKDRLGTLAHWPDDRLATSLYECGAAGLTGGGADWVTRFGDLLSTFPESDQAAKVVPAVDAAEKKTAKAVSGNDPCTAVQQLHTLNTQITQLSNGTSTGADDLGKVADRADRSGDAGEYECGVKQYRDGDFEQAQQTMQQFVTDNPHHKNLDRARKIAIGAEVAQTLPAAGRKLPTTDSGSGISVTVRNDSPDDITVLYTGPVTGSFTLKACGSCKAYSFASSITRGWEPCSDSGKNYPQRTISLPPGTTYFVHKPKNDNTATPGSDTAKLRYGYVYTECAYTTEALGSTD